MFHLVLAAALAAGPTLIEPWGFSLEAKGDALVLAAVRPGSPADLAQLAPGTSLKRIVGPRPSRAQAIGTLDGRGLGDVRATLAESSAAELTLDVETHGARSLVVLERPAAATRAAPATPAEAQMAALLGATDRMNQHSRLLSRDVGVYFADPLPGTAAWVDPAKHVLRAVVNGGATGRWVYVHRGLRYACPGQPRGLTVRVAGLPEPLVFTTPAAPSGVLEVLLPAARLGDVEQCPRSPLSQRLDFELKCDQAPPLLDRDTLRLDVKCAVPPPGTWPGFTGVAANVSPETLVEGTTRARVGPWRDQGTGPQPKQVDVLVLDPQGHAVHTLRGAWLSQTPPGQWEDVELPASLAPGSYAIALEATWADGSTSRGPRTSLEVLSRADAANQAKTTLAALEATTAVRARLRSAGLDRCDTARALPWLRAQPEVAFVGDDQGGSYTYRIKKAPNSLFVECAPQP